MGGAFNAPHAVMDIVVSVGGGGYVCLSSRAADEEVVVP